MTALTGATNADCGAREGEALAPQSGLHPCGTPAAAQRHHRRGEPLCEPCRDAQRTYNRDYARAARQLAAWRARQAETKRRWDAAHREQLNKARRAREARLLDEARSAVDDIAIERACAGEPMRLTHAERLEAVRILHSRGLLRTHIAQRLRLNGQTVNSLLAALSDDEGAVA